MEDTYVVGFPIELVRAPSQVVENVLRFSDIKLNCVSNRTDNGMEYNFLILGDLKSIIPWFSRNGVSANVAGGMLIAYIVVIF